MFTIYETWTKLKTIAIDNSLSIDYLESSDLYNLSVTHEQHIHVTELWKNTDIIKGIDITQNNLDIQDFEDNYKDQSHGITSESNTIIDSIKICTTPIIRKNYKSSSINVEADEQEYDLGSIYTEFSIMVTGVEDVIIKLNSNTNDEIYLKGGQNIRDIIGLDSFELNKIYHKTIGSGLTSKIFIWAVKK